MEEQVDNSFNFDRRERALGVPNLRRQTIVEYCRRVGIPVVEDAI